MAIEPGRLVRSVRRHAANAQKWAAGKLLYVRDYDTAVRYRRLDRQCIDPDYFIRGSPSLRLVYIEVPKAASSTIQLLIAGKTPGEVKNIREPGYSGLTRIEELGLRQFFELADRSDALTFTFVRDPYRRVLSTYRDKVLPFPLHDRYRGLNTTFRRYFGRVYDQLDQSQPMSFPLYIEMIAETCATTGNGHWALMDRIVPQDGLDIDLIGRVENLDRDIAPVLDHLEQFAPRREIHWANRTGDDDPFTADTTAMVRRAYRDDFERFDYKM